VSQDWPFREAYEYRIKRDYSFLNHRLKAGNRLIFTGAAYAPHVVVTRYWFKSVNSGETNAWHIFDNRE
jgi:hypothetical protein